MTGAPPTRATPQGMRGREIALVDLLDRVLAGGVVISGDITLTIADIDLVQISLRALVASVRDAVAQGEDARFVDPQRPELGAAAEAGGPDAAA
ncbi:gas vesicle protein [Streptomyces sp. NPDC047108]|uniref:gas vesicle protein n=1 Tax=Streptomyces sp. NPDC047108 TaxID=3155025 RepID=UPI00340EF45B